MLRHSVSVDDKSYHLKIIIILFEELSLNEEGDTHDAQFKSGKVS